MPAESTGPPAVGSPRIPRPPPPAPLATGVVVFSQPASAAPAPRAMAAAPPRRNKLRREMPDAGSERASPLPWGGFEGPFKAGEPLFDAVGQCQGTRSDTSR